MEGAGHWKDWVQSKLKEKRDQALRKPTKKNTVRKVKKKKDEEKEKDEFTPPTYFDLKPFQEAFEKF